MSYSFQVRATNKAEAKAKIAAQMAIIVQNQPIHAKDELLANTAAGTFIDLLADDESQDVVVSMNGYVSWNGMLAVDAVTVTAVGVGVNASLSSKEMPKS